MSETSFDPYWTAESLLARAGEKPSPEDKAAWAAVLSALGESLPEIEHPIMGPAVLARYYLEEKGAVDQARRLLRLAVQRDRISKGDGRQAETMAGACMALIRYYESQGSLTDRQRGELAEAYEQAIPYLRDERHEDALAMICYNLGRSYHLMGKPEQAVNTYKLAAVSFRRKLVGVLPPKVVRECKECLADACFWIGYDSRLERPEEAIKSFEESITIYTLLAATENTDSYDILLARGIEELLIMLLAQGEVEESEGLCLKLISLLEEQEEKQPWTCRPKLRNAYVRMGNIQAKLGGGRSPLEWYGKALDRLEKIQEKSPEEEKCARDLGAVIERLKA